MKCPTGSEEMFYLALSAFHISHFKSISYWFQLVYCKIGLIAVVYSFYPHSSWFFNHLINNTPHQFSLDNIYVFSSFSFSPSDCHSISKSFYFSLYVLPRCGGHSFENTKLWVAYQSWVAESEYSWLVSWRASRTLPFAYVFLSEYW